MRIAFTILAALIGLVAFAPSANAVLASPAQHARAQSAPHYRPAGDAPEPPPVVECNRTVLEVAARTELVEEAVKHYFAAHPKGTKEDFVKRYVGMISFPYVIDGISYTPSAEIPGCNHVWRNNAQS